MNKELQDPREIGTEGLEGLKGVEGKKSSTPYADYWRAISLDDYAKTKMEEEYSKYIPGKQQIGTEEFGESSYDYNLDTQAEAEDLGDLRGREQSGLLQLTNGTIKGAGIAATTFLNSTVGSVWGAGSVLYNQEFDNLYNNGFFKTTSEFEEKMEKWFPNYQTKEEREAYANGEWYTQLGTANFWGDHFIKNMGFTVGAMYAGSVGTAALRSVGLFKSPGSAAAAALFINSNGESSIEAFHGRKEYLDSERAKMNEAAMQELNNLEESYQQELSAIDSEIAKLTMMESETPFQFNRERLEELYKLREQVYNQYTNDIYNTRNILRELDLSMQDKADAVSNQIWARDMALLLTTEAKSLGSFYRRGFEDAASFATNIRRTAGNRLEYLRQNGYKQGAYEIIQEGGQELHQKFITETSKAQYEPDSPDAYAKAFRNKDSYIKTVDTLDGIVEGFNRSYGDPSSYEEGFIGALTGALPRVSIGKSNNSASDVIVGQNKNIALRGGFFGSIIAANRENEMGEALTNEANAVLEDYITEKGELLKMLGAVNHFTDPMDGFVEENEKFEYQNAKDNQDYLLTSLLLKAGQRDFLEALTNINVDELSQEQLDNLAKNMGLVEGQELPTTEDLNERNPWYEEEGIETATPKRRTPLSNEGEPITKTEEGKEQLKKQLKQNQKDIKEAINGYAKSMRKVASMTRGIDISNEALSELTWLDWKLSKFKSRMESLDKASESLYLDLKTKLEKEIEYTNGQIGEAVREETKDEKGNVTSIKWKSSEQAEELLKNNADNKSEAQRIKSLMMGQRAAHMFLHYLDLLKNKKLSSEELKNFKKFEEAFKNITNNDDTPLTSVLFYDTYNELMPRMVDSQRLHNLSNDFLEKFIEYTLNPENLENKNKKIEKEEEKKEEKKKEKELTEAIVSAKTVEDLDNLFGTMSNIEKIDALKKAMQEHPEKTNFLNNYLNLITLKNSFILAAEDHFQNDSRGNYKKEEALLGFDSLIKLNNGNYDGIFNLLFLDQVVRSNDNTYKNDIDLQQDIRDIIGKIKEIKRNNGLVNPAPAATTPPPGNNNNNNNTSNNKKKEPEDPEKESKGPNTDNLDEIQGEIQDSGIPENNSNEVKEFWHPIIGQYHKDAGKGQPFERLSDLDDRFTNIYFYLEGEGAFEYVNDGKLQKDDEIGFMIDPSYEETVGNTDPNQVTIFMVKGTQVVGSLPLSSKLIDSYVGMKDFREGIIEEYKQHQSNERFYSPTYKTKVLSMMAGKLPFVKGEEWNLNGLLPEISSRNYDNIHIGMVVKGWIHGVKSIYKNIENVQDLQKKDGHIFMFIKNAKGTYSAVALRTEYFKADSLNNHPISKKILDDIIYEIYNNIDNIIENKDEEAVKKLALKLKDVVFGDNFRLEIKQSENTGKYQVILKKALFDDKGNRKKDTNGNNVWSNIIVPRTEGGTEKKTTSSAKEGVTFSINIPVVGEKVSEEDFRKNFIEALEKLNVPYQIDHKRLDNKTYKESIIEDNLLSTNTPTLKQGGVWFVTAPLDKSGTMLEGKIPSKKGKITGNSNNIGNASGNVNGVGFYYNNLYFFVNDKEEVRDSDGNLLKNKFDIDRLLIVKSKLDTPGPMAEEGTFRNKKYIHVKDEKGFEVVLFEGEEHYKELLEALTEAKNNSKESNTNANSVPQPPISFDTEWYNNPAYSIFNPAVVSTLETANDFVNDLEGPNLEKKEGIVLDNGIFKKATYYRMGNGPWLAFNKNQVESVPRSFAYRVFIAYDTKGKYSVLSIGLAPIILENTDEQVKKILMQNGTTKAHDIIQNKDISVLNTVINAFDKEFAAVVPNDKSALKEFMDRRLKELQQVSQEPTVNTMPETNPEDFVEVPPISAEDIPVDNPLDSMLLDISEGSDIDFSIMDFSSSEEQINIEEELKWLDKVLPQIRREGRVRVVETLINVGNKGTKAQGAYHNALLVISKLAKKGTVYHEAFHDIFDIMLSEKEKKEILAEAKQKWGDKSDKVLEEFLAEDFREFVIAQEERSVFSKIKDFFVNLFNVITAYKFATNNINTLYRKINNKYYANKAKRTNSSKKTAYSEESYTQEMLDIKAKAIADGTFMKAPNGKPSNLNERQWLHVRTKAFKKWFGDWTKITQNEDGTWNIPDDVSKVIDTETGEPLVVYHGTNSDFYTFDESKNRENDRGFYLTNNEEMAKSYGQRLIKAFVNIRNPIEVIGEGTNWNHISGINPYDIENMSSSEIKELYHKYRKKGLDWYEFYDALGWLISLKETKEEATQNKGSWSPFKRKAARNTIKAVDENLKVAYDKANSSFVYSTRDIANKENEGKDGVIFKDIYDYGAGAFMGMKAGSTSGDVFVAYSSNQIKSATDNIGTYDESNDDIRYREVEEDEGLDYISEEEYEALLEEYELSKDKSSSFIINFLDYLHINPKYKADNNARIKNFPEKGMITNTKNLNNLIFKILGIDIFDKIPPNLNSFVGHITNYINNNWEEELQKFVKEATKLMEKRLENLYTEKTTVQQEIRAYTTFLYHNTAALDDYDKEIIENTLKTKNPKSKVADRSYIAFALKRSKNKLLRLQDDIKVATVSSRAIINKFKLRLLVLNTIPNIKELVIKRLELEYKSRSLNDDDYQKNIASYKDLYDKVEKVKLLERPRDTHPLFISKQNNSELTISEFIEYFKDRSDYIEMLTLINKGNPDLKIRVQDDKAFEKIYKGEGDVDGVGSLYDLHTNTIHFRFNVSDHIILHELIHAGTSYALTLTHTSGVSLEETIKKYINYISDYLNNNIGEGTANSMVWGVTISNIYGLSNANEFVAEIFSNTDFQEMLDSIPAMETKKYKSLLAEIIGTFIDKIYSFFNKKEKKETALTQAQELAYNVLKFQSNPENDIVSFYKKALANKKSKETKDKNIDQNPYILNSFESRTKIEEEQLSAEDKSYDSIYNFENLPNEVKSQLEESGISKSRYNSLTFSVREQILHCMGI